MKTTALLQHLPYRPRRLQGNNEIFQGVGAVQVNTITYFSPRHVR